MGQVSVNIPGAPETYTKAQMDDILRVLRIAFQQVNNPGELRGSTLVLTNLPTSSAGLPAGSVWNDGGILKVV